MMAAPCCRHISSLFLDYYNGRGGNEEDEDEDNDGNDGDDGGDGDNIGIIKIMTKLALLAGKIKSAWSSPGFTRPAAATAT